MNTHETPNDYWNSFCGSTPPEEFASDTPEAIDRQLNAFLDGVYDEQNPVHGEVPDEPRDDVFAALRRCIRDAVGR